MIRLSGCVSSESIIEAPATVQANKLTMNSYQSNEKHAQITEDFIAMLQENIELQGLTEKSIKQAKISNPDPDTNPVQTLDQYYDFLDWSATCLPWDILKTVNENSLYARLDQSLNYFYFLIDQPLPELAGKGLYYPCLEYYEPITLWVKKYCKNWGSYLSTEDSWNDENYQIVCNESEFNMDKGWYGNDNIWKSFNDWFSRRLISPDLRPLANADIISPADSLPQGVWEIDENSQIKTGVQFKSVRFYKIQNIIGEDSRYKDEFASGALTHTFLDVNDYHRYHFPISGTILEVRKIPAADAVGGLISWDEEESKYIHWDKNPGWQALETRDCLIMDTKYGKIAILPVGMSQVSSCNWEDSVRVGAKVQAGDPMGYFLFGGSDIIMIFQKGVNLILTNKKHLLQGEAYANIKCS